MGCATGGAAPVLDVRDAWEAALARGAGADAGSGAGAPAAGERAAADGPALGQAAAGQPRRRRNEVSLSTICERVLGRPLNKAMQCAAPARPPSAVWCSSEYWATPRACCSTAQPQEGLRQDCMRHCATACKAAHPESLGAPGPACPAAACAAACAARRRTSDWEARPLSAAQAAYAALDAHALVRIYDALAARVGRAALLALCGGRVAPGALAGRGGGASDGAASADGACREAGNGILRAPAVSLAGASERVPDSGSAPAVRDLNAPCDGAAAAGVWEASTVRESRLGQRADAVTHVCGAAGSRPSGLWIMRCCGSAVFGGTLLRGGRASGLRSAASGLRLRTAWRRMPGSGSAAAGRPPCAGSVAGGCRWLQSRAALQSRPLACLRGQLRSGCAAL